MSFSRRGMIAAGLAIVSVTAIGVTSTLNAGAATIATTNETPADAPDSNASPAPDATTTSGPGTPGGTTGSGPLAPPSDVEPDADSEPDEVTPPPDLPGDGPAQVAPQSVIEDPLPEGEPLPIAPRSAPKGNPLEDGAPDATIVPPRPPSRGVRAAAALSPINFMYSSASQTADSDGTYGYITVAKPTLLITDFHSLAEVTSQSADGQQAVEVGWTVDRAVNGDAEPHLFVYHWVDGHESCYNACGFVQYSSTVSPGSALPVGVVKRFSIQHFGDAWWVGYDTEWVGYYPDSLWDGNYTRSGLSQWFGEVAALLPASCSDMGNGLPASNTSAAAVTKIGFYNGPAQGIATGATSPYYTVYQMSAKAFRFGGAGAC